MVSSGVDPSDARKEIRSELALRRVAAERATAGLPPVDSFEAVAREWHTKNLPTWAPSHSSKIIRRLEQGMASTLLHECGWPSDVIERHLSHPERNAVKAAYHAEHLPARRKMMQAWADHLDALRKGGKVISLRAKAR